MLHTILIKTKCSHIRLSSPMGCADEESEDDDKVFSHDQRKVFCSDGMWQEMDEGSLVFCGAKVQKPNACKRSCGSE